VAKENYFFSLLLFAGECLKRGFTKGVEVGSGPGFGGLNHVEVGTVLPSKFELKMFDPMAKAGKVVSGFFAHGNRARSRDYIGSFR